MVFCWLIVRMAFRELSYGPSWQPFYTNSQCLRIHLFPALNTFVPILEVNANASFCVMTAFTNIGLIIAGDIVRSLVEVNATDCQSCARQAMFKHIEHTSWQPVSRIRPSPKVQTEPSRSVSGKTPFTLSFISGSQCSGTRQSIRNDSRSLICSHSAVNPKFLSSSFRRFCPDKLTEECSGVRLFLSREYK
jgi:hypothetical protein